MNFLQDLWEQKMAGAWEKPEQYIREQLIQSVLWAKTHSRFYKKAYASYQDNFTLEEFAQFPFTEAKQIAADPFSFLCMKPDEISRIVTMQSSGSTGQSKKIFFSAADQQLTIDYFQYGMRTLVNPGEKCVICLPGRNPGGVVDLLAKGLRALGAIPVIYGSIDNLQAAWQFLEQEKPHCLVAMPVQILALCRSRFAPKQFCLPKILFSADVLAKSIAEEITQKWQCTVYHHYGMTEMGYGGALSCFDDSFHMHTRAMDLYFEIVDVQTGQPLKEGEMGEIVFSTLNRRGMPLLRYRTGDMGRMKKKLCPCGYKAPVLYDVQGRMQNSFIQHGKRIWQKDLDEILFSFAGILDFQTIIAGDRLKIQLYKNKTVLPEERIKEKLNALLGPTWQYDLLLTEQEEDLPCFYGKRMIKWEKTIES